MEFNLYTDLPLRERTLIMGILNVTPDSFSDGGDYFLPDSAIHRGVDLLQAGADILDIGGESTRPGAESVSASEEVHRLGPVISGILNTRSNAVISVDTTKAAVADQMLNLGAKIINDISGMQFDDEMPGVIAKHQCPVVLMHIQGTPRTMQTNPVYDDVITDILQYFTQRIEWAKSSGIKDRQIILDPGIGFGKTVEHNLQIIANLKRFTSLGYPVMVGASRKSFIGKILDLSVDQRLGGSLAAAVISVWNGAKILRVHDVTETVRALRLTDALNNTLQQESV